MNQCTIQADDLEYANETCAPRSFDAITVLQIISKTIAVPRRFVERMPNVEHLMIRYNSLTSIDGLSICRWKRLKRMDADFNSLENLTSGFLFFCKQLNQLLLHNNEIKEIASDAFVGLKSLRSLNLSSNQITYLDKNVFKPLKKLENLNLSTNRIQSIDVDLFRYSLLISVLDLSKNDLKTIPTEVFELFDYLEVFYANDNPKLSSINIKYLDSLKELSIVNASLSRLFLPSNVQEVHLSNNQISQLFVEPDNTISILDLSKNCMADALLDGCFNNLTSLSLRDNSILSQSINDLSVVQIKTKYPSLRFFSIPPIDDRKAEQMILEAEENQIDLAIYGSPHYDDKDTLSQLRFDYFDGISFENYNQKLYVTSSIKQHFENKVTHLIVAKTNKTRTKISANLPQKRVTNRWHSNVLEEIIESF